MLVADTYRGDGWEYSRNLDTMSVSLGAPICTYKKSSLNDKAIDLQYRQTNATLSQLLREDA